MVPKSLRETGRFAWPQDSQRQIVIAHITKLIAGRGEMLERLLGGEIEVAAAADGLGDDGDMERDAGNTVKNAVRSAEDKTAGRKRRFGKTGLAVRSRPERREQACRIVRIGAMRRKHRLDFPRGMKQIAGSVADVTEMEGLARGDGNQQRRPQAVG